MRSESPAPSASRQFIAGQRGLLAPTLRGEEFGILYSSMNDVTVRPSGDDPDPLDYAAAIVKTLREPLVVLDGKLRVKEASAAFYRVFNVAPDKTIDRLIHELGDGQWDIGAGVIVERLLTRDLRWGSSAMYTAQLPATLERRLPKSATDSLSDDKENLLRDLGDTVTLGTGLQYMFAAVGVTVGAGYNFQYLAKTTYKNGTLDPTGARYRLLEAEYPYQALHSGTVTAGFSTVEWFREKKFVYPFQANLAYSRPFLGRNVTTNDVFSAELVLFF